MKTDRENFLKKAGLCGLTPTPAQLRCCDMYVENLLKWQKRINLIGPATVQDPYTRHILDAAQLAQHVPRGTVLDVGSGAGIPGLVWSIFIANDIYLCERIAKKTSFLSDTARKLNKSHQVNVLNCDVASVQQTFDIITGRAVTSISEFITLTHHCAHPDTLYILPKGKNCDSELEVASKIWSFHIESIISLVEDTSKILFLRNIQKL